MLEKKGQNKTFFYMEETKRDKNKILKRGKEEDFRTKGFVAAG
jgi:hypothetical protein